MRLEGQGRASRLTPVSFTFDGTRIAAFDSDTVASALLANGVRLVGRSFKYHRPRGVMTAGSEEPNALVTVGSGRDRIPNVRATVQEVFDGLEVASQNRWPSLRTDLMAVNDLISPFIGAGFYYKTFMWPRGFWERLYEPFIRRAAGLGALPAEIDEGRYDKAYAFCDVLVIGGGPAGLMAALTAARAGADVILADENPQLGGRLRFESEEIAGRQGAEWADDLTAELAAMPNVRLMRRTTVTGVYDGGTYAALERVALHRPAAGDAPRECFWRIVARQAILAAGALERHIAFGGNDRPGVMMAGAARAYVNHWGVAPGRRVAVFANNDDAHRTARDLASAGIAIAAIIDTRAEARPPDLGAPVFAGAEVTATRGRLGLSGVRIRHGGRSRWIDADCLAVSGGWNPTLHLASHLGGRPEWNEAIAAFVPRPDAVPGLHVAGAAAGVFSTKGALKSGLYRAKLALEALGFAVPSVRVPPAEDGAYALVPRWSVPGRGRAWLDHQNDVTVKDVSLAARENFRSVEHMKRYTTQGMAADQGKSSNVAALAVLADATGRSIAATGTTTFRPPFVPVSIAAMGAGGRGHGFAPQRFTTSHAASVGRGAPMIEAGLWYRPSYFPRPGESTWRQACDREVNAVRQAVGVCDVSTLGKIDIQGKDAAKLLDFVYTNTFSKLAVGRVRYGLMLREDGFVMDDGTSARLGPEHWLMTTTTAAAGLVMKHIDFVRQGLRPDWDVTAMSVTEQWAQFAVAGPRSRDLLAAVLDDPSAADLPFMGCGPASAFGVACRLFRISFSGELGYEIAIPARYGAALFGVLVAQAEALGGCAYGMEALNVLRIEKGFITHAEIHGRVTADDVGLGRMIAPGKDCIGKTMAARPGLTEAGREQLVGLRPAGAVMELSAGAFLFRAGDPAVRTKAQGYTTSVGYSPTLGTYLGLGFLKDGRNRLGEVMRMVDHLRGLEVAVEITDPVAFDPEGGRMRA